MTHPTFDGADTLHRILTPDEFHQARQLSPQALAKNPFPLLPPAAPKDVVRTVDPNARPDKGTMLTGLPRILTQQLAEPLMDHPLTTAATVLTPGAGIVMAGLMGKDIMEYAAQKAAELSLPEDVRKMAEQDPTRISGERAGVEAAMLGVGALVGGVARGAAKAGDVSGGVMEAGAEGLRELDPSGRQRVAETRLRESGEAVKQAVAGGKVTKEARSAVARHVADIKDAFNVIFDPASRSPQAREAAGILRATTGRMAAEYEQAAFKLDEFRRTINPLPAADKYGFIDAIEGGKSQPTPEFQGAADTMRQLLDNGRKAVQDLGTGKLEHFIEDYFPHIWADPDAASGAFEAARQKTGGTRPMEGSKSFLKQRTIPTTAEGLALGLKPVSDNPVDLTLLKLREMQRYVMAHQSLHEMQDAGLVQFVRAGAERPDGYTRINDKVATVFGPRTGAVELPEGAAKGVEVGPRGGASASVRGGAEEMVPEDVRVMGTRIMGEYWAPEPVARVVNNYLSPGLRGNAIFDAYRGLGNTLNQAQLGFSAFHLGFTSVDAAVSRVALGVEYMATGDPLRGVGEIMSAPAAPITNAILGAKIRRAYLNPETASPDMQALANAVKEAGGRVRQDSFYRNSAPEKMFTALRQGEYGKATALSLPALAEWSTGWLMNHVVPMQKLGVFGDLAEKVLKDLPPDATLAERRQALGSAWDSVDNRMGQLVYDNLFWSKTMKDLSMASVRSVGWNLGTIRELGGGIGDLAEAGKQVATGEAGDAALTHRAAYVIALPITIGTAGAVYQYLRTGEAPSELKDYFFPKTGELDPDGNAQRVQLPSYMKDVVAYAGSPWQTVKHKEAPILAAVYEMLQNQDFYGDQIRNPQDPFVTQVKQEAEYMAKEFVPFSWRNQREQAKRGDQSQATKIGNWFGITPAPRAKVWSEAQNLMADYLRAGAPSGATPEQVEQRNARSDLLRQLRGVGDVDVDKVNNALESGDLTPADIGNLMKRAGMTPAQEKFKRLTLPQALKVFEIATPDEKAKFAELLATKLDRMDRVRGGGTP